LENTTQILWAAACKEFSGGSRQERGPCIGEICSSAAAEQHHHHHIYFRLPERPQKPIELATIKQQKENCKNEKNTKKVI